MNNYNFNCTNERVLISSLHTDYRVNIVIKKAVFIIKEMHKALNKSYFPVKAPNYFFAKNSAKVKRFPFKV